MANGDATNPSVPAWEDLLEAARRICLVNQIFHILHELAQYPWEPRRKR